MQADLIHRLSWLWLPFILKRNLVVNIKLTSTRLSDVIVEGEHDSCWHEAQRRFSLISLESLETQPLYSL